MAITSHSNLQCELEPENLGFVVWARCLNTALPVSSTNQKFGGLILSSTSFEVAGSNSCVAIIVMRLL